jgi:hypothetical protein
MRSDKKSKKNDQVKTGIIHLLKRNRRKAQRHFNPHYDNLSIRTKTIKTQIKKICKDMGLKNETFYLTIAIIDNISSKYLLEDEVFSAISLVALNLAARVKESQNIIFLLNSLKLMKSNSNRRLYEKQILEELEYNVNIITPFDFLMEFILLEESFEGIRPEVRKQFSYFVSKLIYFSTLEYDTNKYNSLVIAMSIIMVSRKLFKCQNLLPDYLREITGFSENVLSLCFQKIYFLGKKIQHQLTLKNKSEKSSLAHNNNKC